MRLLLLLGLLTGCATGGVDPIAPEPPPDATLDGGSYPSLGRRDRACEPRYPPTVCRKYHDTNPGAPWPLDEIPIECGSPRMARCMDYSLQADPSGGDYVPALWAHCCEPLDGSRVP